MSRPVRGARTHVLSATVSVAVNPLATLLSVASSGDAPSKMPSVASEVFDRLVMLSA